MTTTQSLAPTCSRCAYAVAPDVTDPEARQAEATGWHEFHSLVDQLTTAEIMAAGYYDEGWSVRDLMGHVGAWLAEAGLLLEQVHAGTYIEGELDVDAANVRFFELMRGIPLETITIQVWASRWRLVSAWSQFSTPPPAAERWLAKGGGEHYAEHLPRLRVWVAELVGRRAMGAGARR